MTSAWADMGTENVTINEATILHAVPEGSYRDCGATKQVITVPKCKIREQGRSRFCQPVGPVWPVWRGSVQVNRSQRAVGQNVLHR